MATTKTKRSPPTQEEVEAVRQELCEKPEKAANQPVSEKHSALIVFQKR